MSLGSHPHTKCCGNEDLLEKLKNGSKSHYGIGKTITETKLTKLFKKLMDSWTPCCGSNSKIEFK